MSDCDKYLRVLTILSRARRHGSPKRKARYQKLYELVEDALKRCVDDRDDTDTDDRDDSDAEEVDTSDAQQTTNAVTRSDLAQVMGQYSRDIAEAFKSSSAPQEKTAQLPWDRLPATLAGKDNPPLIPYPKFVVEKGTNTIRRVPSEADGIDLKNVAGLDAAKNAIRDALIRPYMFPRLYGTATKQKAFLFYGVPGTGKTTLAEATVLSVRDHTGAAIYRTTDEVKAMDADPDIGDEFDKRGVPTIKGFRRTYFPSANHVPKVILISMSLSDVTSKYIGEGSRKMRRAFQLAERIAPCILFFDEADAYLGESPTQKANTEVITTFKQEQGGFGVKGRDVMTIVATNYPMTIEGAIRSRTAGGDIEITLPAAEARRKIIMNSLKRQFKGVVVNREQLKADVKAFADLLTPSFYTTNNPDGVAEHARVVLQRAGGATPITESDIRRKLSEVIAYTGRDVSTMIRTAIVGPMNDRAIEGNALRCTDAQTIDSLCSRYYDYFAERGIDKPSELWIPVAVGTEGSVPVRDLTSDQQALLMSPQLSAADMLASFIDFQPPTSFTDVLAQMQFNESRGLIDTTTLKSVFYQREIQRSLGKTTSGKCVSIPDN